MKWRAALLVALGSVVFLASPAAASTPGACRLLTKRLAEGYFNTDMSKATAVHKRCDWTSRISKLNRSASLTVVDWRYLPNAKSFFKLGCTPSASDHPRKVRLRGADQACASAGYTGICFDTSHGRECQWQVAIVFRRGSATGELDTVAPKDYSLNSVKHATRLARKVLARWH
jgi:hypothetical protein